MPETLKEGPEKKQGERGGWGYDLESELGAASGWLERGRERGVMEKDEALTRGRDRESSEAVEPGSERESGESERRVRGRGSGEENRAKDRGWPNVKGLPNMLRSRDEPRCSSMAPTGGRTEVLLTRRGQRGERGFLREGGLCAFVRSRNSRCLAVAGATRERLRRWSA